MFNQTIEDKLILKYVELLNVQYARTPEILKTLTPTVHKGKNNLNYCFFRGHGNESCNLIGSLPGQYFPISAHGPR